MSTIHDGIASYAFGVGTLLLFTLYPHGVNLVGDPSPAAVIEGPRNLERQRVTIASIGSRALCRLRYSRFLRVRRSMRRSRSCRVWPLWGSVSSPRCRLDHRSAGVIRGQDLPRSPAVQRLAE